MIETHVMANAAHSGMLFGAMLLTAMVGAYVARLVHLPKVVGLLFSGVALRAVLSAFFDGSAEGGSAAADLALAEEPLEGIKDLALGLILFTIGGVFERRRLQSIMARAWRISLCETVAVVVFVGVACSAAAWLTSSAESTAAVLALGILLATVATETAPAATLSVLQEYDAKGPITDTILGLTGLSMILCIVLFHLAFLILLATGAIQADTGAASAPVASFLTTTLGSVALGVILGVLISAAHGRLALLEMLIVFFGILVFFGASEKWLLGGSRGISYNFLLMTLTMGAVFFNVALDSQKLEQALKTVGAPVYAAFFVMAGYDLHVHELTHMGWAGVAYVIARFAGKELGARAGVMWAQAPHRTRGRLGDGLLCQAAVAIGLAGFLTRTWDDPLAVQFKTIVLGAVLVFELVGPILLKARVLQAGEVKAITLLSRVEPPGQRGLIMSLVTAPLRRLGIGVQRAPMKAPDGALSVQHIMRTNVQLIPAGATLDDVLHFVERSTHSHFPVVDEEGELVGVIHLGDVQEMMYDPSTMQLITAVDLADHHSRVVFPEQSLEDLAEAFGIDKVAVFPVAKNEDTRKIIGIVEQRDLLRVLRNRK